VNKLICGLQLAKGLKGVTKVRSSSLFRSLPPSLFAPSFLNLSAWI